MVSDRILGSLDDVTHVLHTARTVLISNGSLVLIKRNMAN